MFKTQIYLLIELLRGRKEKAMQYIHTIEDRLHEEAKEIANKLSQGEEMSSQCLDNIKDIAISLNQFTTYEAMKNSGYSQNAGYSNMNGYPRDTGYSNNDGYSNARNNQNRINRMVYGLRDGQSNHNWYPEEMSYRMRPEMY